MEATEAVNEGCKFVAQAKSALIKYMNSQRSEYDENYLRDADIFLDLALEKLAV